MKSLKSKLIELKEKYSCDEGDYAFVFVVSCLHLFLRVCAKASIRRVAGNAVIPFAMIAQTGFINITLDAI
jgi:hypothetical protein